jgi:putative colanic acid biosynthesis acetyltransferase WcaF
VVREIELGQGEVIALQIGAYGWVRARASVAPGGQIGEGAVVGLGSLATCNLEPWTVYTGAAAIKGKERRRIRDENAPNQ